MVLEVDDQRIEVVAVVDDEPDARETWADDLRDAEFTPRPLEGPFSDLESLVRRVMADATAAVCDHHLKEGNYAAFSGAAAVNALYGQRVPAVLVTAWSKADLDEIRRYRRGIPVLLTPGKVSPDAIAAGFQLCIREFRDLFLPARRPWKTLVRVEDVQAAGTESVVYAVLPGWNSTEVIRIPLELIPAELRERIQPGEHFFATVNRGAEDQADLYFRDFEYRGK